MFITYCKDTEEFNNFLDWYNEKIQNYDILSDEDKKQLKYDSLFFTTYAFGYKTDVLVIKEDDSTYSELFSVLSDNVKIKNKIYDEFTSDMIKKLESVFKTLLNQKILENNKKIIKELITHDYNGSNRIFYCL